MLFKRLLAIAALSTLLVACGGQGRQLRPSAANDAPLEVRAKQRWDLIISRDLETAWQYLSPGYRLTKSQEAYVREIGGRPTRWLSARVDRVECEDATTCVAVLQVEIEAVVPGAAGGVMTSAWVRENWLQVEGVWYHVP